MAEMTIRRFSVFSVAKIQGLLAFVIGLLIGILGFIGGLIAALVYNLAAGVVGGVRFELEGVEQPYAPPPPEQWNAA